MGAYPTGPNSCAAEPSRCTVLVTSFSQAAPLTIFSFWAAVAALCVSFQAWRLFHLRRNPVRTAVLRRASGSGEFCSVASDADDHNGAVEAQRGSGAGDCAGDDVAAAALKEEELRVSGFSPSRFGDVCYAVCCFTSLHWLLLHILILFDTYNECQVGGIDNLCFYGNHVLFGSYDFNGKIFFIVWWLSALWFTTWVLFKGRVRYWFRLPCSVQDATEVCIWTRESQQYLSSNDLFLVRYARLVKELLLNSEEAARGHTQIVNILTTKAGQKHFFFQGHRFLIKGGNIIGVHFRAGDSYEDFHRRSAGLVQQDAEVLLEELGPNEIPFRPESLLYTVFDETFTLFHVYQLVSYILQFWSSYLFVAALMTCIVLLSALITIITRRRAQLTIAKITKYVTEVEVLRSGVWVVLDSRQLVPGDLIKIKSSWAPPCDVLLIQGSCVCDESALTGEPMPVQKYAAPCSPAPYKPEGLGSKHTLFSGTKILQAGNSDSDDVRGVVSETGMATSKGELVAAILYPQRLVFKYDEELQLVALLLLLYALVCFSISVRFQNINGQQSIWVTKWIYCMFIINQIMSPLLPVALEVGQLHAVRRLKKRGIFCLNPKRIAIAGKIRVFCFDKTGTLTKEGLDFVGVQQTLLVPGNKLPVFGGVTLPDDPATKVDVLHGISTCHAVSKFGDELVGNQVEVKMFSAVGWQLIEEANMPSVVCSKQGRRLRIVKRNEFDQSRATMSVIVEDESGHFHIYCKGSFERIKELSTVQSVPVNYAEIAKHQASQGCYVLALSYRYLGSVPLEGVMSLSRDDTETSLDFLGLILFRNELKSDSPAAISALKEGKVRPVMVTGDNAQCGHYIARQVGMVDKLSRMALGDVDDSESCVSWRFLDNEVGTKPALLTTQELLSTFSAELEDGSLELAVTGKAFSLLRDEQVMDKLLLYTRIFARFTPSDKEKVVGMHRNCGLIVGMCGDGGNDCGALRAAHAGIALSAAEASVVSPFTATTKTVSAVVDLLREGRAALHTSFACYKFLIIYGLQFSIFKLACYWYGIIACQMDYIFVDGVAVLSLGYSMTRSQAKDKLKKVRPTSSLLGYLNSASILGVWASNVVFLVAAIAFMASQKNYVRWPAQYSHGASWWTLGDNWESTVLFFTMYFQFITAGFIFSFGAKFRKNVFRNWALNGAYSGLLVICSLLLLLPPSGFTSVWHVASEQFNRPNTTSPVWAVYQKNGGLPSPAMPFSFRLRLWFLILGSIASNMLWQKVVVEGPVSRFIARRCPSNRPRLHV